MAELQSIGGGVERRIDEVLTAEWQVPLGGSTSSPRCNGLGSRAAEEVADELRLVRSSLSRRLDRLEEEGWVETGRAGSRRPSRRGRRADPRGRRLAGDEHVTYLRALQVARRTRGPTPPPPRWGGATTPPGAPPPKERGATKPPPQHTPLGKRNGKLKDWHPVDLAAETLKALVERTGIDPALVDDVVMGCVMQVGEQGVNIARNAVLAAGWPETCPARPSTASAGRASRPPTSPPRA